MPQLILAARFTFFPTTEAIKDEHIFTPEE